MNKTVFLPEWDMDCALTVFTDFNSYYNLEKLAPFYATFHRALAKHDDYLCIIKNKGFTTKIAAEGHAFLLEESGLYYPDIDIWVRDYSYLLGRDKWVEFDYDPSYLEDETTEEQWRINPKTYSTLSESGMNPERDFLHRMLQPKQPIDQNALVIEGGNIVHNGQDFFVCDSVCQHNPDLSEQDIVKVFTDLGARSATIIPAFHDDPIAHADAYVRFIDAERMFVVNRPGFEDVCQEIRRMVSQTLPEVTLIEMPMILPEDGSSDDPGIPSAHGCHINYFQTKHAVYFPIFNISSDAEAVEIARAAFTHKPLEIIDTERLSLAGGGLHCAALGLRTCDLSLPSRTLS